VSEHQNKTDGVNRRQFISGVAAASAFTIIPRHVLGGTAGPAPSDKLNIAGVGFGGMGKNNLKEMETENIVALCDVDWKYAEKVFERYPKAFKYKDYRAMFDREKDIDAVVVATPDHHHALVSMRAMQAGKHVYTQKPLTHTVYEARLLAKTAKEQKIISQMGNQAHSAEEIRLESEWLQAGVIGAVTEVHTWTDRPVWTQGVYGRPETQEIPEGMDWDNWIGPARFRGFNKYYHPWSWRGWWDFGTGSLGDMGCHKIDHPWTALKLTYPTMVSASYVMDFKEDDRWQKRPFEESFPKGSIITYNFPERDGLAPVRLTWYDGGLQPPRPEELDPRREMPTNGSLYIGEKGKLLSGDGMVRLIPESAMKGFTPPPKTIPRIEGTHEQNWIKSIKENKPASSDFSYAGPLTETVLLGNVALRFPYEALQFDAENMAIKGNDKATALLTKEYRKGWEL